MRVLQIHNQYREAGGEDSVVASEAQALIQAGHEVVQHQVQNPSGRLRGMAALAMSPWNPASAHQLRSLAASLRPDVAHVHNTWFSLSPAIFGSLRRAGTPVVMTLHNYRLLCCNALLFRDGKPCQLCVGSHPWHGLHHLCYRGSVGASAAAAATIAVNRLAGTWSRNVDLFLVLTEFGRDLFLRGGMAEERLVVKPNSVPDPGLRSNPPSASKTVLFVGRLSEDKGLLPLLNAWRDARPEGLELLVVGDGPLRDQLGGGHPGSVQMAGRLPRDRVRELMLSARALVFPSIWYEGQPMVLLEALAAGLPILAANLGGTAATLRGADPNWLVEAGEGGAWQAGLARLGDDAAVDAAGRQARQLYEQSFTPARSLTGLEEAYRRAIERFGGR